MAARRRERCSSAAEMLHFASHGCQVVREGDKFLINDYSTFCLHYMCALIVGDRQPCNSVAFFCPRRLSHRRQMRGSALESRVKILFFDGWGTRGRRGIYFKYAHRHTQTHIARTTFSEERRDRFWLAAPRILLFLAAVLAFDVTTPICN